MASSVTSLSVRTPVTSRLVTDPAPLVYAGRLMGTLATAQPCGNVEEFARACGVANHPFLQLLLMAWSMRGRQVRG